jgi:hypothetical protein
MRIEKHMENLRESIEVIEECVKIGRLTERQRTIGFHTSVGSVELLEVYLHKKNLIDPGMQLKHDWFDSKKKVESKLPFDFPNKDKVISLITKIENRRNILCYGAPQEKKIVIETIQLFQELRKTLEEMGVSL